MKPDPRIFELTLERLKVPPEKALFVDDLSENVEAALRLGMHGIVRQTTDQMIADVEALLSLQGN